ncbi:hypothetical protein DV737_g5310, partial [Chaetothyriales sp. CBS 132003]
MLPSTETKPSLEEISAILAKSKSAPHPPNLVPVCAEVKADLFTPTQAYLKVSKGAKLSFLYESAATTGTIGRHSFVGANPRKVLQSGPGYGLAADPLPQLEKELAQYRVATVPSLQLPPLTGGAIGYVAYDCVQYFEPKTKRPMQDPLKLPESFFMLYDTIVAFDHFFNVCKVITYLSVPDSISDLASAYAKARATIEELVALLEDEHIPLPDQRPVQPKEAGKSNIGKDGYEAHVTRLKKHIHRGDIIQGVPSHRISRPTDLHPFNIYRHLRTVNPSPYLFYIDCHDFSIIGASPELLVKEEAGRIITHPIAGTVKRTGDPEVDEQLAEQLRNSIKDRAEHVMLVDLARNDINRVCDPLSTRVDRLMVVEKFSHVQHLVSQVSGILRPGETRFTAFRSIFPAGTVSGAPKVRAMELIAELEGEKRGVYAGAVGYFGFSRAALDGSKIEDGGAMDTCIALRTMVWKDGVAYLQAGGGIVFDSDEEEEWIETLNKLGSNIRTIDQAERYYLTRQALEAGRRNGSAANMKLNISYPANGSQKLIEIEEDRKLRVFLDKKMGQEVPADSLGDEWKGYVVRITGGNDKQGFPMKQGVMLPTRVKLLLSDGHSCYRPRRTGERKRKSVRGCIVAQDLAVLALSIVKQGESDIPGLTDVVTPKRLGPKRATKIRKFFGLSKQDDVRKFVIRREVIPKKEGAKPYTKAPKIQRLVTPQRLQHKRHRLALKRRRAEASKDAATEYAQLLAKRVHEERDKKTEARKRRASSLRK